MLSGREKVVFLFVHSCRFRRSLDKWREWPLSRDDIFQIQVSSADGNFELFSFSAYFSSSFLF